MRIEHDLNMEIDRLMQNSGLQKQRIAEAECRLMAKGDRTLEQGVVSIRKIWLTFRVENCKFKSL